MTLQQRISALITAIGSDVKALYQKTGHYTVVATKTGAYLQGVINSASAGSTIYLSGTYDLSSGSVTIQKNLNVVGFNATLDGGSTNHVLMIVNSVTRFTMTGVKFTSTDTGSGYSMLLFNEVGTVSNVYVDHCEFTAPNGAYNAVSVTAYSESSGSGSAYSNINFTDNNFHDLNRMGLEIVDHSFAGTIHIKGVTVSRNRFHNLGTGTGSDGAGGQTGNNGMGISFSGEMSHVTVEDNRVTEFRGYGIEFIGTQDFTATNNILTTTKNKLNTDGTVNGPSNGYNLTDGNHTNDNPSNPGRGAKRGSISGGEINVTGRPFLTYYATDLALSDLYMKGKEITLQNSNRITLSDLFFDSLGPSGFYFDGTSNSCLQGGRINTSGAVDPKYQQIAFVNGSSNNWIFGAYLVGTPANGVNVYPGVGNDSNNNRWIVNIEGTGLQTNPATLLGTTDYNALSNKPTLGTAAALDVPSSGNASSSQVVKGSDGRLTDARTPTTHTHTLSQITQSGATTGQVPTWNGSAYAPATPATGGSTANYWGWDLAGFSPLTSLTTPYVGLYAPSSNNSITANSATAIPNQSISDGPVAAVIALYTGTNSAGAAHMAAGQTSSTPYLRLGTNTHLAAGRCYLSALPNATDNYNLFLGYSTGVTSAPANFVGFRIQYSGGAVTYQCVCRAAGTETTQTFTVTATSFFDWKVVINNARTSVSFYINRNATAVATITTNVPAGSVSLMAVEGISKTAGTTGVFLYVHDFWAGIAD